MDQIVTFGASAAIFLSFVAYSEARDALQSWSPQLSLRQARIGGLFAGASVLAICAVADQLLMIVDI